MTVTEYSAKVFEPETIGEAVVLSIQPRVVPFAAAVELWNWPLVHAEAWLAVSSGKIVPFVGSAPMPPAL